VTRGSPERAVDALAVNNRFCCETRRQAGRRAARQASVVLPAFFMHGGYERADVFRIGVL
jgi:hypothetical protein